MDVFNALSRAELSEGGEAIKIKVVDMHTSGEPTRIIIAGYPVLPGRTLLEKRACASERWDGIRKWLMREPRGHSEMYGAILVSETELTQAGEADIGVLFCHNEGYSTMCGHATIALGRFLVDTADEIVFPTRTRLRPSPRGGYIHIRLHAPCGVVRVDVPVTAKGKADPSKPVEFLSVPSFVGGTDVLVDIPTERRWKGLRSARVRVDVAYGGAFYAVVDVRELGFLDGLLGHPASEFAEAARVVKELVGNRPELIAHPIHRELEYLYGIIITDDRVPTQHAECGLCFFADQQIDRSPTGSGVCARAALSVAKGSLRFGEIRTYESIFSIQHQGNGFSGTPEREVRIEDGRIATIVRVAGFSYYTSAATLLLEPLDTWKEGLSA